VNLFILFLWIVGAPILGVLMLSAMK